MRATSVLLISCAYLLVFVCHSKFIENDMVPCLACVAGILPNVTATKVPLLYHTVKSTIAGSVLLNMIHSAAYAATRGWIYGGLLEHSKIEPATISFIFNVDSFAYSNTSSSSSQHPVKLHVDRASELGSIKGPPWAATAISYDTDDWQVYEKKCPTEDFPRFKYSDKVPILDSLFPPVFLSALRTSNSVAMQRIPLRFNSTRNPKAPRVTIHLRRGPLLNKGGGGSGGGGGSSFSSRKNTPDSYYFSIVEIIRDKYPLAEIHAFPLLGKRDDAPVPDFAGYTKRNITLHYDVSTVDTWAHMIAADFLVMAHSVFSAVPALLNPNCVVYDHFWHGKLARYLTMHTLKDKMHECYKLDSKIKKTITKMAF